MRSTILTCVLAALASSIIPSMAAAAGPPVKFSCSGAAADAARKIAKANTLKLGMDPKACFGEMKLTESDRKQIVVSAPSPQCKKGNLLDVYDRSRAGPYYSLFKEPVCGSNISVGPRSPYGDNLITIDGRQYLDKAGAFVLFK